MPKIVEVTDEAYADLEANRREGYSYKRLASEAIIEKYGHLSVLPKQIAIKPLGESSGIKETAMLWKTAHSPTQGTAGFTRPCRLAGRRGLRASASAPMTGRAAASPESNLFAFIEAARLLHLHGGDKDAAMGNTPKTPFGLQIAQAIEIACKGQGEAV
jgi:hypothetical protein